MAIPLWSGDASRNIVARIVIEGELVLQTPAHFGNGDTDDLTDMPLLVDPLDGRSPLLTGASIAGALRSYLRERERGYRQQADPASVGVALFGGLKADDNGEQSSLVVDDALGRNFGIEMRDGVRIRPDSRTAEEDKLFNFQLWQGGTTFPLRFELLVCEGSAEDRLKQALATALEGLSDGSITLGARKRRGYGRVSVSQWRLKSYDMMKRDDLLDWIQHGDESLASLSPVSDIKTALGVAAVVGDHRHCFHIHATFSLDGSLLIRSGGGKDDVGPDMVHLRARQANAGLEPVLSGTSLGGALRSRALRIANTLDAQSRSRALVDQMFGAEMRPGLQPHASRISVQEHVLQNSRTDLVQNRVSIDRFTSGARETAFFNEQPAFGGDETTVTVDVQLVNPRELEIGLLLLLLKDLWTSDLPLGGESSVGRGRLKGRSAMLTLRNGGMAQTWTLTASEKGLAVTGDRDALDDYVKKHLKEYFTAKP